MTTKKFLRFFIPTIIVLVAVPFWQYIAPEEDMVQYDSFKCIIALEDYHSENMNYDIGFNYEMLGRFASAAHSGADIRLLPQNYQVADSLLMDSVDILVLPSTDTLAADERFKASTVLEDGVVWLVHKDQKRLIRDINNWLSHCEYSPEYENIVNRFVPSYHPVKRAASGRKYKTISPYDDLIHKYSEKIGWDWRMLAALIWHESNFRIEASSYKGAKGLMQMMPTTALRHGADDVLDPEMNIRAGTDYLLRLNKIFSRYAKGTELFKFVLGAYNAGEGRIINCIRYGKEKNLPYSSWEDIVAIIRTMREDPEVTEDKTCHLFKGHETVRYVETVVGLFYDFCSIASGPNVPDRLVKQKDTVSATTPLLPDTTGVLQTKSPEGPDELEQKKENNCSDPKESDENTPADSSRKEPQHCRSASLSGPYQKPL